MIRYVWILAGLVSCGGTTKPDPLLAQRPAMTCELRVNYARTTLAKMDVSVSEIPKEHLVESWGAPAESADILVVSPDRAHIDEIALAGDWQHRAATIRLVMRNARITGRPEPLHVAFHPSLSLLSAMPWLDITTDIAPPTMLLVTPPATFQYVPLPPPAHRQEFKRLATLDWDAALDAVISLYERPLSACTELNHAFYRTPSHVARTGDSLTAMRFRVEGIPEALQACNCAADVETVVATIFAENATNGTTIVRTLPLPNVEIVRKVSEKHPNMTMQQFIDHCMMDESLAKRLNWHPYRDEHISLRGLRSN